MTRINIDHARHTGDGEVSAFTASGAVWIYKAFEVLQGLVAEVNEYGSINPAKWDCVYDPAEEDAIALLEADGINEWDEQAQRDTACDDAAHI